MEGSVHATLTLLILIQQIYEPYVLYGYFNLIEHHKTIEVERKHWLLNLLVELFCEAKPRGVIKEELKATWLESERNSKSGSGISGLLRGTKIKHKQARD